MGRIITIGGGELSELETLPIDRYIVQMANKLAPRSLFIPTASGDADGYIETFEKIYGQKLGCETDVLLLVKGDLTKLDIQEKIQSADLIYVGGGDTAYMLSIWKSKEVDQFLKHAYNNGTILSGLSAGAICWFEFGHSELSENPSEFICLEALGLVPGFHCPHYNKKARLENFDEMVRSSGVIGVAIEDKCAVEFYNRQYRVIKASSNAKAFKITSLNGAIQKEELVNTNSYLDLNNFFESSR